MALYSRKRFPYWSLIEQQKSVVSMEFVDFYVALSVVYPHWNQAQKLNESVLMGELANRASIFENFRK